MIGPMYSAGSTKFTRTIGWRNSSISPESGTFCGLWMSSVSPLRGEDLVGHVRRGLHQVEVGLLLQPLLDDLHVQQAQEAAAEAEAQGVAGFGLELEAGVVDRELRRARRAALRSPGRRTDTARSRPSASALDSRAAARRRSSPGTVTVSPMCTSAERLDVADQVADLAGLQALRTARRCGHELAQLEHLVRRAGFEEADLLALATVPFITRT